MNMEAHQRKGKNQLRGQLQLQSEEELSDLDFHYLSEGSESEPETEHPDFTFENCCDRGNGQFLYRTSRLENF